MPEQALVELPLGFWIAVEYKPDEISCIICDFSLGK